MADTPKKPTSFDVARLAGVHRSQVSRALSGQGRMSDDTRQKVIDSARQLGYRVNFLARSLQSRSSGLVGIVASRLDTPYRATQVRAAAREFLANGFTPILVTAEGGEDQSGLVERLLNYSVSGMMITSGTPSNSIIDECAQLNVPVVLINRNAALEGADHVLIDVDAAGQLAFDMLVERGGQRFAVLQPRDRTYSVLGRASAFSDRCRAAGYCVDVLEVDSQDYDAGLAAADGFVQQSMADSVFCTTDLLALGFLDGLRVRHGVSIPDQVQVLGFDDIPQAAWLSNSLSTIWQASEDAATEAVNLILERITDPTRPHETFHIPLRPVHRGTTRKTRP
ncbi:MAG: LacI family transcriptional regulator [Mameliella sp.]|nr:LacI family transcriptional regulator [Mameliella sp.]|tara:strand:+ start:4551 stop:5564 length:1014 start_codon:yes stop_codon:yes gene_type:complete